MMRRSMAEGGIRVGATPRQDGGAIDDQIARANQAVSDGQEHGEDEETFMHRRASGPTALALLRWARNPVLALLVHRQAAGVCQGWPGS